jgi:thiosulfate/3-mercaptopyruvate sulfurtransferase
MSAAVYNTLISVEELSNLTTGADLVVLDCRYSITDINKGRIDYLHEHIPGAFFMDMEHDLTSQVIKGVTGRHPLPHPEVLAYTLMATGINPSSQVVIYDHANGMAAARGWWLLNWLGHDRVAVLNGGFMAWKSKSMPVDNQWPAPAKGSFDYKVRDELTTSLKDVASGKEHLIDSRDYKRFTGETEPIDPVAGHIPGARCIPFIDNTDEHGYWRDPAYLRSKFSDAAINTHQPPVFYCGSGITACHNILAYKIATGQDARLYPGSWSEWINYYPAATGG